MTAEKKTNTVLLFTIAVALVLNLILQVLPLSSKAQAAGGPTYDYVCSGALAFFEHADEANKRFYEFTSILEKQGRKGFRTVGFSMFSQVPGATTPPYTACALLYRE
jgi:hypothetical protein